jgi:hypothetical protein
MDEEHIHLIAFSPTLNAFTDLNHLTGQIKSQDSGILLNEYAVFLNLPVSWVQSAGQKFDEDETRTRLRYGLVVDEFKRALFRSEQESFLCVCHDTTGI